MLGYYSRVEPPAGSLEASTYSSSLEPLDSTDQEEKLDKALSKLKGMTAYIISLALIGQNPAGLLKVLVCCRYTYRGLKA